MNPNLAAANAAYHAGLAHWRDQSQAFSKVKQAYRSRLIGDKEFLEAKAVFDAESRAMDLLEANLIAAMDADRKERESLRARQATYRGADQPATEPEFSEIVLHS
jgi:hypothetical protein